MLGVQVNVGGGGVQNMLGGGGGCTNEVGGCYT